MLKHRRDPMGKSTWRTGKSCTQITCSRKKIWSTFMAMFALRIPPYHKSIGCPDFVHHLIIIWKILRGSRPLRSPKCLSDWSSWGLHGAKQQLLALREVHRTALPDQGRWVSPSHRLCNLSAGPVASEWKSIPCVIDTYQDLCPRWSCMNIPSYTSIPAYLFSILCGDGPAGAAPIFSNAAIETPLGRCRFSGVVFTAQGNCQVGSYSLFKYILVLIIHKFRVSFKHIRFFY